MRKDTQWGTAWLSAFLLSIGLGIIERNFGVAFLSAGLMGFLLIGTSLIANRWHQIKRFIAAQRGES